MDSVPLHRGISNGKSALKPLRIHPTDNFRLDIEHYARHKSLFQLERATLQPNVVIATTVKETVHVVMCEGGHA